jgi:predicted O-linked N-acetylglucosamine transferase (SPINDLY family)
LSFDCWVVGQSIASVLALHDRSKFEVYAYPRTPRTDSLTYNRTLAGADVVFDPALVSRTHHKFL